MSVWLLVLACGISAVLMMQAAAEWRFRVRARGRMLGQAPARLEAVSDLLRRLDQVMPPRVSGWYRAQLQLAGWERWTPGGLMALQALSAGLALAAFASAGADGPLATLGSLLAAGLPLALVRDAALKRSRSLEKALPEVVDLLTTCVEAGLSFDLSLHRVTARLGRGVLRQELELSLSQMKLGQTRRDALKDLVRRTRHSDLRSLVSALIQADQMGAPLGPALRAQSIQLRSLRGQRVQKAAAQAPVKLLFPLMAFILPVVFLVLFGPLYLKWSQGGF